MLRPISARSQILTGFVFLRGTGSGFSFSPRPLPMPANLFTHATALHPPPRSPPQWAARKRASHPNRRTRPLPPPRTNSFRRTFRSRPRHYRRSVLRSRSQHSPRHRPHQNYGKDFFNRNKGPNPASQRNPRHLPRQHRRSFRVIRPRKNLASISRLSRHHSRRRQHYPAHHHHGPGNRRGLRRPRRIRSRYTIRSLESPIHSHPLLLRRRRRPPRKFRFLRSNPLPVPPRTSRARLSRRPGYRRHTRPRNHLRRKAHRHHVHPQLRRPHPHSRRTRPAHQVVSLLRRPLRHLPQKSHPLDSPRLYRRRRHPRQRRSRPPHRRPPPRLARRPQQQFRCAPRKQKRQRPSPPRRNRPRPRHRPLPTRRLRHGPHRRHLPRNPRPLVSHHPPSLHRAAIPPLISLLRCPYPFAASLGAEPKYPSIAFI